MKKINIELEFQSNLQRVKLNPETMSSVQMQETKRAFYAGVSQMWRLFIDIGELPEQNVDHLFEDIESQLSQFWKEETAKVYN